MSAVFRKGGDVSFLVQELGEVFDPAGGYWNGPKHMPSLVAHIGLVLEEHLRDSQLPTTYSMNTPVEQTPTESGFPPNATLCKKCSYKAVILKDGCPTCLNCGDSKCG